jgi:hypothetical protein
MQSILNQTNNGFIVTANLWTRWADKRDQLKVNSINEFVSLLCDEFWLGRKCGNSIQHSWARP